MRSLHRYATDALVLLMLAAPAARGLLGRWRAFGASPGWTGVRCCRCWRSSARSAASGSTGIGSASSRRSPPPSGWTAAAAGLSRWPATSSAPARSATACSRSSSSCTSACRCCCCSGCGSTSSASRARRCFRRAPLDRRTLGTLLRAGAGLCRCAARGRPTWPIVPTQLQLDWFVLFVHPLTYATSAGLAWVLSAAAWLLLLLLPFLPHRRAAGGGGRCRPTATAADAASPTAPMPRSRWRRIRCGRRGRQLAQSSMPTCAPAAASAPAPARRRHRFAARRAGHRHRHAAAAGRMRCAVRCSEGWRCTCPGRGRSSSSAARGRRCPSLLAGDDVLVLQLLCAGQLPPSFVEYALRDGAAGVLVASCSDTGGCAFRLGARWTAERLAGAREPHLRASVPRRTRDARAGRPRRGAGAGRSAGRCAAILAQIKDDGRPDL
jgi:hypothetical protein